MFDCGGLKGNEQLFTTQLTQEQSPRFRDIRSVFPDQITFSNSEMFQIKKAFRHSVLPHYMPLYVLYGERRHIKVMELFSNWHDTALFRPLHKQPDFQRCSKLIVWRAWNSSTFKNCLSRQLEEKWCRNPWTGRRLFLPHHISADLLGKWIFLILFYCSKFCNMQSLALAKCDLIQWNEVGLYLTISSNKGRKAFSKFYCHATTIILVRVPKSWDVSCCSLPSKRKGKEKHFLESFRFHYIQTAP